MLRQALFGWAFNPATRDTTPPPHIAAALDWAERASLPVTGLEDTANVRLALAACGTTLAGKPAAGSTQRRKRSVFYNALGYAVELGHSDCPVRRSQGRWAYHPRGDKSVCISAASVGMRYTGSVSNAFVQSMAHNFEQALRLMEAALTDCPDDLWQTDLWPEDAPTGPAPHGGLHGSAPWFLGYHALLTLDYDLAAEFEPWAPPQPFDDNTYAFPNRRFTKPELLGYVDWCRSRVRQTLDGLNEEMATRPLPSAHRYHGMLFAVIVGSLPLHVVEHASQIRQFLTAAGVTVQPMPGDRGYTGPELPSPRASSSGHAT